MFQYKMLRDEDIGQLGEGVIEVLDRVGIICQNREMLEALEKFGVRVDYDRETATFPKQVTEHFVEQIKGAGIPDSGKSKAFGHNSPPTITTQVAQFLYDYETKERRSGNSKDFIEVVKFGNSLHPETSVGHALLLTDVPAMVEPLEAAMIMAEYADKPGSPFAWNVRQVKYLREMGGIYGIDEWFSWGAMCFAHPLRFDRDVADRFVPAARSGRSIGLTAMPVAGATTPVSPAGFIVVAAAEIVAGWIAGRALNPKIGLGGSIWGGSMDMKSGLVSYSSFDAMFYSLSLNEFLRKWAGQNVGVGAGEYCDAKEPGYYAALEKAYKSMIVAAFTGSHSPVGQGMLEDGKTLCLVQLLLEREFSSGVQIFGRPIEVSPETIRMDDILDIGFGLDKSYFGTDYTLLNFNEHLWCPELLDRSGWQGAKTDEAVLQKLQERVKSLIASYRKPEVDPDKLAKMRKVVDRARKELLS